MVVTTKMQNSLNYSVLTTICYSSPLYPVDWLYHSFPAGRKFLHHCDIVHKFSENIIMQRRKELILKVELWFYLFHAVIHIQLIAGLTATKKVLRFFRHSPFSKGDRFSHIEYIIWSVLVLSYFRMKMAKD